jgi:glycosyltransferase involved in cell wall biosynthesis
LITVDWYFWSHRLSLARAARDAGFEVVICTLVDQYGDRIRREGFKLIPIGLIRRSKNPFREIISLLEVVRIYRKVRPDIVHHVAIKPVLYGSVAAAASGVRGIVNALGGLGHVYVAKGLRASILRWVVGLLYRGAFRLRRSRVIIQTKQDQETLVGRGIVAKRKTVVIQGSGVDPDRFVLQPEPDGVPVVMLAGRLLWNKGVDDFVRAGRILKSRGIPLRMVLVGAPDPENPLSVPEETLRRWQERGDAQWWGRQDDMPDILARSNLVVLPTTYGEGVPKILLEAAAVGRALIATRIPGCSDIVRHGENGLLVPVKNVNALAAAIEVLIEDRWLRMRMGKCGRAIVEAEFSEKLVVAETFKVYNALLGNTIHPVEPI